MNQPKSVAVIGQIVIILSVIGLLSIVLSLNPEHAEQSSRMLTIPLELSIFINASISISLIYFAVYMMKGYERARVGLLWTYAIQVGISFLILNNIWLILPSIPIYFALYFFLTRPHVLLYFQPENFNEDQKTKILKQTVPIKKKRVKTTPGRRLLAIFGFIFSGNMLLVALISMSIDIPEKSNTDVFMFIIIAGVGLQLSSLLWANDPWKILGIALIVVAGISSIFGLSMLAAQKSPEDFPMPPDSFEIINSFDVGFNLTISFLFIALGIAAIVYQKISDQKADRFIENDVE